MECVSNATIVLSPPWTRTPVIQLVPTGWDYPIRGITAGPGNGNEPGCYLYRCALDPYPQQQLVICFAVVSSTTVSCRGMAAAAAEAAAEAGCGRTFLSLIRATQPAWMGSVPVKAAIHIPIALYGTPIIPISSIQDLFSVSTHVTSTYLSSKTISNH